MTKREQEATTKRISRRNNRRLEVCRELEADGKLGGKVNGDDQKDDDRAFVKDDL